MSDDATPSKSWLERLSHLLLREPKDREQLIELLRDAEHRHLLDPEALSMIEGVLEFSEMQVRDILIPRTQMTMIEETTELENILPSVIESGHSRFPVYNSEREEVVGLLLAKDLLKFTTPQALLTFDLKKILRTAMFVPESKRLDKLLQEFRRSHQHMAIVIDEYGALEGLVTIEDVLEQIVGDIEDEYDINEEAPIKRLSDTQYSVKALIPISEFNQYFDTSLDENEFDTLGGIVTHAFGRLPEKGESIMIDHLRFKILKADHRRVYLLKVTTKKKRPEL